MKVGILKEILKQYNDNDLVYLEVHIGTMHRIDHCDIKSSPFDDDLIPIKSATKDGKTNSLILKVE